MPQLLGVGLRYLLMSAGMFLPTWLIGQNREPSVPTTLLQVAVGVATYSLLLILTRDPAWMDAKKMLMKKLHKSTEE